MKGKVYAGISRTLTDSGFPAEYEQKRSFGWHNIKVHPSYHGDSM